MNAWTTLATGKHLVWWSQTTAPRPPDLLLCLAMAVSACSGNPPVVMSESPIRATPNYPPSATMPVGLGAPPRDPASPVSATSQNIDHNGVYTGTAEPLDTGGGVCIRTRTVTGFRVRGNSVRFGGFCGRIAADGGLQMTYSRQWIIGRFDGADFRGHLYLPGPPESASDCTYQLRLQRMGH
jgi:hypothetical protein